MQSNQIRHNFWEEIYCLVSYVRSYLWHTVNYSYASKYLLWRSTGYYILYSLLHCTLYCTRILSQIYTINIATVGLH